LSRHYWVIRVTLKSSWIGWLQAPFLECFNQRRD
jgi:hypothetical protein